MYRVNSWMKSDFGLGILMHLMDMRDSQNCERVRRWFVPMRVILGTDFM